MNSLVSRVFCIGDNGKGGGPLLVLSRTEGRGDMVKSLAVHGGQLLDGRPFREGDHDIYT